MKRRVEESKKDDAPNKNFKRNDLTKKTLVVLPGAGGSIGKDMLAFLESDSLASKYDVKFPKTGWQWNIRNPQCQENFVLVNSLLKGVPSDSTLILMGHSFGNRVIAHMLENDANFAKNPKPEFVVFCAYPLFAEKDDAKNNAARKAPLTKIPLKYSKIVFISGENDEFLNRSYQKMKSTEALV
jgi:predicted alpha/beta hydrolase family esterase